MRRTHFSRKIFVLCNTVFLILVALLCFLPLVNLFAISLSGKSAANSGLVTFWPVDFTTLAYIKTFHNNNFIRSLVISFLRTGAGTLFGMFVITTAGYALSKEFRGRTALMWFFVFTMLFGGGLIPSYLVNTSLGLKNNFLVYILPGAFSCYNLILIMNFFKSIPRALEEAALIDGASSVSYTHLDVYKRQFREGRTLTGRKFLFTPRSGVADMANTPVQGTAADILKRALGLLFEEIVDRDWKIVGIVHDEILMEVPEAEAMEAAVRLKAVMERAGKDILRSVPCVAEAKTADSWAAK